MDTISIHSTIDVNAQRPSTSDAPLRPEMFEFSTPRRKNGNVRGNNLPFRPKTSPSSSSHSSGYRRQQSSPAFSSTEEWLTVGESRAPKEEDHQHQQLSPASSGDTTTEGISDSSGETLLAQNKVGSFADVHVDVDLFDDKKDDQDVINISASSGGQKENSDEVQVTDENGKVHDLNEHRKYTDLASENYQRRHYEEAIENYLQALAIFEPKVELIQKSIDDKTSKRKVRLKNRKTHTASSSTKEHTPVTAAQIELAAIYNNIGTIYTKCKNENPAEASFYFEDADDDLDDDKSKSSSMVAPTKSQSLQYFQKSLEIREQIFGKKHPEILTTLNNIGSVYYGLQDFDTALHFYKKVVKRSKGGLGFSTIRKRVSRPSRGKKTSGHEDGGSSVNSAVSKNDSMSKAYSNIGSVYYKKGLYNVAKNYYSKALNIQKKEVEKDQTGSRACALALATIYSNIGSMYVKLGENEKALFAHTKALGLREKHKGESVTYQDMDTASSHHYIGNIHALNIDYDDALESFQKALDLRLQILDTDLDENTSDRNLNISIISSYNAIGLSNFRMKKYEQAIRNYEKSVPISEEIYGPDHPITGMTYNNLGTAHYKERDFEQSLSNYLKALSSKEEIMNLGPLPIHQDMYSIYTNVGAVYWKLGDKENAKVYFQKAFEADTDRFMRDHATSSREFLTDVGLIQYFMNEARRESNVESRVGGNAWSIEGTSSLNGDSLLRFNEGKELSSSDFSTPKRKNGKSINAEDEENRKESDPLAIDGSLETMKVVRQLETDIFKKPSEMEIRDYVQFSHNNSDTEVNPESQPDLLGKRQGTATNPSAGVMIREPSEVNKRIEDKSIPSFQDHRDNDHLERGQNDKIPILSDSENDLPTSSEANQNTLKEVNSNTEQLHGGVSHTSNNIQGTHMGKKDDVSQLDSTGQDVVKETAAFDTLDGENSDNSEIKVAAAFDTFDGENILNSEIHESKIVEPAVMVTSAKDNLEENIPEADATYTDEIPAAVEDKELESEKSGHFTTQVASISDGSHDSDTMKSLINNDLNTDMTSEVAAASDDLGEGATDSGADIVDELLDAASSKDPAVSDSLPPSGLEKSEHDDNIEALSTNKEGISPPLPAALIEADASQTDFVHSDEDAEVEVYADREAASKAVAPSDSSDIFSEEDDFKKSVVDDEKSEFFAYSAPKAVAENVKDRKEDTVLDTFSVDNIETSQIKGTVDSVNINSQHLLPIVAAASVRPIDENDVQSNTVLNTNDAELEAIQSETGSNGDEAVLPTELLGSGADGDTLQISEEAEPGLGGLKEAAVDSDLVRPEESANDDLPNNIENRGSLATEVDDALISNAVATEDQKDFQKGEAPEVSQAADKAIESSNEMVLTVDDFEQDTTKSDIASFEQSDKDTNKIKGGTVVSQISGKTDLGKFYKGAVETIENDGAMALNLLEEKSAFENELVRMNTFVENIEASKAISRKDKKSEANAKKPVGSNPKQFLQGNSGQIFQDADKKSSEQPMEEVEEFKPNLTGMSAIAQKSEDAHFDVQETIPSKTQVEKEVDVPNGESNMVQVVQGIDGDDEEDENLNISMPHLIEDSDEDQSYHIDDLRAEDDSQDEFDDASVYSSYGTEKEDPSVNNLHTIEEPGAELNHHKVRYNTTPLKSTFRKKNDQVHVIESSDHDGSDHESIQPDQKIGVVKDAHLEISVLTGKLGKIQKEFSEFFLTESSRASDYEPLPVPETNKVTANVVTPRHHSPRKIRNNKKPRSLYSRSSSNRRQSPKQKFERKQSPKQAPHSLRRNRPISSSRNRVKMSIYDRLYQQSHLSESRKAIKRSKFAEKSKSERLYGYERSSASWTRPKVSVDKSLTFNSRRRSSKNPLEGKHRLADASNDGTNVPRENSNLHPKGAKKYRPKAPSAATPSSSKKTLKNTKPIQKKSRSTIGEETISRSHNRVFATSAKSKSNFQHNSRQDLLQQKKKNEPFTQSFKYDTPSTLTQYRTSRTLKRSSKKVVPARRRSRPKSGSSMRMKMSIFDRLYQQSRLSNLDRVVKRSKFPKKSKSEKLYGYQRSPPSSGKSRGSSDSSVFIKLYKISLKRQEEGKYRRLRIECNMKRLAALRRGELKLAEMHTEACERLKLHRERTHKKRKSLVDEFGNPQRMLTSAEASSMVERLSQQTERIVSRREELRRARESREAAWSARGFDWKF